MTLGLCLDEDVNYFLTIVLNASAFDDALRFMAITENPSTVREVTVCPELEQYQCRINLN